MHKPLILGGVEFKSRLFLGTGKFSSAAALKAAIEASGTELVTVAMRRVDLNKQERDDILGAIDRSKVKIMLNTSGARTAEDAVKIARFGKDFFQWIKLEIHPDPIHLLPDPIETLKAAEILVKEGFIVLPYINADPVLAKRLEDVGVHAVMPLGAQIGSGQGIRTEAMLEIIIEDSNVPVVIDAGLGLPSHAAVEERFQIVSVDGKVESAGTLSQIRQPRNECQFQVESKIERFEKFSYRQINCIAERCEYPENSHIQFPSCVREHILHKRRKTPVCRKRGQADVNFLDSAFHRRNPSLPVYPGSLHCSPLGHFPRTDDVHQRTGG